MIAGLQDVEVLKQRVQVEVRPVDGGEGHSSDTKWEEEQNATVDKLDRRLLQHESDMLSADVARKREESLKASSKDYSGAGTD
jgi:hypothetical protein